MFNGTTKGITFGELAVLGDYAVAGGQVAARIGVEGMADTASITSTKSVGNLAVGGDFALGDLTNELVYLIKEVHNLLEVRCTSKRKTDNNFLVKILSRFSATRLRSVLQLVCRNCTSSYLVYFLSFPNPSMALRTSMGTAKTIVLLASLEMSLIELRVRR